MMPSLPVTQAVGATTAWSRPFSLRERCKHAHVASSAETKYPPRPFLSMDLKPVEVVQPKVSGVKMCYVHRESGPE